MTNPIPRLSTLPPPAPRLTLRMQAVRLTLRRSVSLPPPATDALTRRMNRVRTSLTRDLATRGGLW